MCGHFSLFFTFSLSSSSSSFPLFLPFVLDLTLLLLSSLANRHQHTQFLLLMSVVETFHGYIANTTDSLLLYEACRRGLLPRVSRRLQEKERNCLVRSGSVFVFDEKESGNEYFYVSYNVFGFSKQCLGMII